MAGEIEPIRTDDILKAAQLAFGADGRPVDQAGATEAAEALKTPLAMLALAYGVDLESLPLPERDARLIAFATHLASLWALNLTKDASVDPTATVELTDDKGIEPTAPHLDAAHNVIVIPEPHGQEFRIEYDPGQVTVTLTDVRKSSGDKSVSLTDTQKKILSRAVVLAEGLVAQGFVPWCTKDALKAVLADGGSFEPDPKLISALQKWGLIETDSSFGITRYRLRTSPASLRKVLESDLSGSRLELDDYEYLIPQETRKALVDIVDRRFLEAIKENLPELIAQEEVLHPATVQNALGLSSIDPAIVLIRHYKKLRLLKPYEYKGVYSDIPTDVRGIDAKEIDSYIRKLDAIHPVVIAKKVERRVEEQAPPVIRQWTAEGPYDPVRERITRKHVLWRCSQVLKADLKSSKKIGYGEGKSSTYHGIWPEIKREIMDVEIIFRTLDSMGLGPEYLSRLSDSDYSRGPSLRERLLIRARQSAGGEDNLRMSFMMGLSRYLYKDRLTEEQLKAKGLTGVLTDFDKELQSIDRRR